jgi:spoIIIJ-associated protein
MTEIEIEGKTVEDAISEGLAKLGVGRDQVEIKILSEGSTGLFGLMGSKASSVRLTLKSGLQPGCEAVADLALVQTKAKELLGEILRLMKISYSEINTSMLTGRVYIDVKSTESALIIGKGGQTLDALEMILNLMLAREPQTRAKVNIDTEKYRVRQEEKLSEAALRGAATAKTSGKPFRFEPMNAHDRRLVHLALKADPAVETFSEGEGLLRSVIVKPKQ